MEPSLFLEYSKGPEADSRKQCVRLLQLDNSPKAAQLLSTPFAVALAGTKAAELIK